MTHLETLESEAIHILREVAGEFERPVLLFSGGKDSTCLLRLAEKAFRPARFPFPLLHIDTGWNFPEVIAFRDKRASELGETLIVRKVAEREGMSRNRAQSPCLLAAIREHEFDCAIGGARRDEEKARAKERVFSLRGEDGAWTPEQQRPEPWGLYNTRLNAGEHMRVFPLSNWTECDVWEYIVREELELPPIYFSHPRDGRYVRVRTVADTDNTGFHESSARNAAEVLLEIRTARGSERGSRGDDKFSPTAMEDRKREGYF